MDSNECRDFLLGWLLISTEEWRSYPSASFPRNSSGILLNERIICARDGWVKPDIREWREIEINDRSPMDNPLPRDRRQMTTVLRQMERDGLVELIVAENNRILWVRLTDAGRALAEPLCAVGS